MAHKYLVDLTDEEQRYLYDVIRKGKRTARRVARAHVGFIPTKVHEAT